jgi:hypothetical protein
LKSKLKLEKDPRTIPKIIACDKSQNKIDQVTKKLSSFLSFYALEFRVSNLVFQKYCTYL